MLLVTNSSKHKSWKFRSLACTAILSVFLVCSCNIQPSPPDSAELLRDGLNTYCVRINLSLSDIDRTIRHVNFKEDSLAELKILQAKMNQFRIFAKPDIFSYIAEAKAPLRNRIVPPAFWEGGGSDIPEIYFGITYVSNSVVNVLIDKLERKETLTEQEIMIWEQTKKHLSAIVDNLKEIDGNYEEMATPPKIEAIKNAVYNARVLQEINLKN
ncbi:MAG TPA: hypothetical protein GX691_04605 [Clostridia bacterium]|nr:hypothetical protein [Clostridia bacterium]